MEVLLLSTSKFSSSAAYSALPAAAVLLPKAATDCTFKDYLARCCRFSPSKSPAQHQRQVRAQMCFEVEGEYASGCEVWASLLCDRRSGSS